MSRRHSEPPELRGFTFVKVLGSGGFSDVYLYEQQLPKRNVAVKVLLTEGLTSATRAAFVAEANLMAQLSHPYIVKIYHADVSDDGRPFLIMEYCPGANLAERYKKQPLSVVEVLRTGIRLSGAVATAHAAGILHRDIKPANVLTNDYGWPALTDFGISSALEDDLPSMTTTRAAVADSGATTGSQSVGMSIPWSPPEMFEDDPKPDVRSDVFSLAATIYTLLAGRTPFEVVGRANQSLDLMSRIERGAITPMERTDVPSSLLAVLRKGMATQREQRFGSAVDFARALQRVELELSYSPTPIDVPNLVVPEPDAPQSDDHADATRARSVTTVAAQPVVAPPPRTPPRETSGAREATPPAPVVGETVVRGSAPEQTMLRSPSPRVADAPKPQPARRRPLLAVLIAGGATALVVAAIIILSASGVFSQSEGGDGPSTAPVTGGDGPIVITAVPTPTLVSKAMSADGTVAEFAWQNPDAQDGDTYVWERTDGAGDDQRVPTSESQASVTGVSPGTTVCIAVYVRRGGELSAEPLEECLP